MRRRFLIGGVLLITTALAAGVDAGPVQAAATAPKISPTLTARDPQASLNAQRVYAKLVSLENTARAGGSAKTIIGQHIETQNELYNASYADYTGTKAAGYLYKKAADITGRLPGLVEADLGPGYGTTGDWGTGNKRSYDASWPSCQHLWSYTDAATDVLFGVWKGAPRAADTSYNPSGQTYCDGTRVVPPANGGSAAGIVGMSFHEPYPGSAVKGYDQVLCRNSPTAKDPAWFHRVVDWQSNTPEYQALLHDLSYAADQLSYYASYDVPVLWRPYHEMNTGACGGFWWSGQNAADYKVLWQIQYNYLVRTRGLHNLIFVWAPESWGINGSAGGSVPWNFYPGAQYVDVVGVSDYNETPSKPVSGTYTSAYYRGLQDYAKPRALAESFYLPINASGKNALTSSPWVTWTLWGQALTQHNVASPEYNSNADVKATYYATAQVLTGGSGSGFGQNFDWGSLHAH